MKPLRHPLRRQRGIASLIVVMVLFFVISLAAAYTNRNLIFEQRTSANQYRATQAAEAAQAGIEWAVALLNAGRITTACVPDAGTAANSFRQRYLTIDAATGMVAPRASAGGVVPYLSARCVFNGAGWNCDCPANDTPNPAVPVGAGPFPAYAVRFTPYVGTAVPGVVRLESIACVRASNACLDFDNTDGEEGRARMSALVGLVSGMKTPPAAALTARGNVSATAPASAANPYPEFGTSVQAGGTVSTNLTATGPAGSPAADSVRASDGSLSGMAGFAAARLADGTDRMFAGVFGLAPSDYAAQPAAYILEGCPCGDLALRAAITANPGRPIWVRGDLDITGGGTIGSAAAPVVVVVTGNVTASSATTFNGLLYGHASAGWSVSGPLRVNGAVAAGGPATVSGGTNFIYDRTALDTLRYTSGSFVVTPGSWKDYR